MAQLDTRRHNGSSSRRRSTDRVDTTCPDHLAAIRPVVSSTLPALPTYCTTYLNSKLFWVGALLSYEPVLCNNCPCIHWATPSQIHIGVGLQRLYCDRASVASSFIYVQQPCSKLNCIVGPLVELFIVSNFVFPLATINHGSHDGGVVSYRVTARRVLQRSCRSCSTLTTRTPNCPIALGLPQRTKREDRVRL